MEPVSQLCIIVPPGRSWNPGGWKLCAGAQGQGVVGHVHALYGLSGVNDLRPFGLDCASSMFCIGPRAGS